MCFGSVRSSPRPGDKLVNSTGVIATRGAALPYRDPVCSDNDSISNRAVDVILRLTISSEATREIGSSLHFGQESFESHAHEVLFNSPFIRLLLLTQSTDSYYLSLT